MTVINTNVSALIAQVNLDRTQQSLQHSIERLSSGLRINRAADDAAGLAISDSLTSAVRGTEQSGDRLIVYHDTARGMRFVALNLNLVKGRREFLALLDARLRAAGFEERVVDRSRYLSR